jgi:hypothetical protein
MATRNLFLQLPPELGGVRFGPFPGNVTIGSDPKRSQIVLDPSMGIFPSHALLGRLGDGSLSLSPGAKEAKVFLMPNGQPHVWPITSAVQVNLGDQIIVGTPTGPRFQLLGDQPMAAAPSAAQIVSTAQRGGEKGFVQSMSAAVDGIFRPTGGGISGEVQRQLTSRALARNPWIRDGYTFWTRFRSGSLFSPYMVVGLMFAVISMLGAGTFSCSGAMWVLWDMLGFHR